MHIHFNYDIIKSRRNDIDIVKQKLLKQLPLFANIINETKFIEDKSVLTVATNGKDIFYNTDFTQTLSEDEVIFSFANAICHIAFNHILRSEGKDQKLWNIATDAVINQFLNKDGLKLPEGAVDIADALNHNVEEFYKILLEQKENDSINIDGENSTKKM